MHHLPNEDTEREEITRKRNTRLSGEEPPCVFKETDLMILFRFVSFPFLLLLHHRHLLLLELFLFVTFALCHFFMFVCLQVIEI